MEIGASKEIALTLTSSINWLAESEHDMEFTLLYKGPLLTNPNATQKHEIRRYFHPQLKELWRQKIPHRVPGCGQIPFDKMPLNPPIARELVPAIAQTYEVCGKGFVPLVTKSLMLACRVNIFFLSKTLDRRIIERADLDNRLKGLFDGLRRPNNANEMPGWLPTADEEPFYCLLEDDSLVTDIRISGDTLLDPSITDPNHYHLIIRVKVRPLQFTLRNADFA